jgi:hypothetical protein
MKTGLCLMSVFFFTIFLSGFFRFNAVLFFIPIVWFYSFFDCVNKMSLPDEKFYLLEDKLLFPLDGVFGGASGAIQKYRPYIGGALIFAGLYIIWDNVFSRFSDYLTDAARNILSGFTYLLPQFAIAGLIIFVGVKLIIGKGREVR